MTTPKVKTTSKGGSRFYVHPVTGDRVPGVTSVVSMLPKPFLSRWAAKSVAEFAVEHRSTVLLLADDDPAAAVDVLKNAPWRDTRNAANRGSAVHAVLDRVARGEPHGLDEDDEIAPYVAGFSQFVERFQPEFLLTEETVWSEKYGYAGTFDALAVIGGEVVLLDYKTGRSGVHAEAAVQLTAYANADYILRPDGTSIPMPRVDGAAVLHLQPDSWSLVPVATTDEVFEVFVSLLTVFSWETELSKAVLGRPL